MALSKIEKLEQRKDEKKKVILKTASAMFAEKGYHQTTVKDITDCAGISVGTFYLYFKNKEDLFEKLYDVIWQYLCDLSDYAHKKDCGLSSNRFARVITASLWGFQKFKDLTKIMLIEAVGLNPGFEKKYAEFMKQSVSDIENHLAAKKKQGLIKVSNIKVAATAYIGAMHTVITCWLRDDTKTDLCDSTYPLVIFLMQAISLEFDAAQIKQSIDDMLQELESDTELSDVFRN